MSNNPYDAGQGNSDYARQGRSSKNAWLVLLVIVLAACAAGYYLFS